MLILYSTDQNILDIELKNYLTKFNGYEIVNWSSSIINLYNEINQFTLDLFPKIYVLKDVEFFQNNSEFENCKQYLNLLANSSANIIIVVSKIKFNDEIDKFFKIVDFKQLKTPSLDIVIKDYFDKFNIKYDDQNIADLIQKLPNNNVLVYKELEKIRINNFINSEIIENLIYDYQTFDIFKLSESLLKKELNLTLKYLDFSVSNNVSIEEIVAILSSYIFKIYILKVALNNGMNKDLIVEKFKVNKYWWNNIYFFLKNIPINRLKYILDSLFNFDLSLKTINIDKYLNFKLLLLNFFKE